MGQFFCFETKTEKQKIKKQRFSVLEIIPENKNKNIKMFFFFVWYFDIEHDHRECWEVMTLGEWAILEGQHNPQPKYNFMMHINTSHKIAMLV